MAADLREQILARMATVIATNVAGIESAARNLDQQSEIKTPAIVLYDGDEEAFDNPRATGGSPNVVHMLPIIALSLGDVPENVGTTTNEWRAKVLKAVLLDSDLETLCGRVPNAGVRYLGCTTSLTQGRTSQVEMIFNFSVAYPFKPLSL